MLTVALAASILAACGGGQDPGPSAQVSPYEQAVGAAASKASEVRRLASPAPCTADAQCTVLQLSPTLNDPCNFTTDIPYSRISATATQAESATTEYEELARQARSLAPANNSSCSGFKDVRALVCASGSCLSL